jgi:hypothetical protein
MKTENCSLTELIELDHQKYDVTLPLFNIQCSVSGGIITSLFLVTSYAEVL